MSTYRLNCWLIQFIGIYIIFHFHLKNIAAIFVLSWESVCMYNSSLVSYQYCVWSSLLLLWIKLWTSLVWTPLKSVVLVSIFNFILSTVCGYCNHPVFLMFKTHRSFHLNTISSLIYHLIWSSCTWCVWFGYYSHSSNSIVVVPLHSYVISWFSRRM